MDAGTYLDTMRPPSPAPVGRYLDGSELAEQLAQPDSTPKRSTEFLTESCRVDPIYLIRQVRRTGRLSPVDDDEPLQSDRQSFESKRVVRHAPQRSSGGPAGMSLDVDEERRLDGLAKGG